MKSMDANEAILHGCKPYVVETFAAEALCLEPTLAVKNRLLAFG